VAHDDEPDLSSPVPADAPADLAVVADVPDDASHPQNSSRDELDVLLADDEPEAAAASDVEVVDSP